MTNRSCLGCTERYEACHATCDRYRQEKAKHDAEQEMIKAGRNIEMALDDYAIRKHERLKHGTKGIRRKR